MMHVPWFSARCLYLPVLEANCENSSRLHSPLSFSLCSHQRLQLWQKTELLPIPLGQILHGHLTGSDLTDKLCLLHTSFVSLTLTWSPFALVLFFQIMSFFFKSSNVSVINTKSSAQRNFQEQPSLNSFDKSSMTIMKGRGLSTAPWWIPTLILSSSLNWPFRHTQDLAFSYIPLTASITHSSTATLLIAHTRTFLGTRSKAFFKSTKGKYRCLHSPRCFSCNWCRINIASDLP